MVEVGRVGTAGGAALRFLGELLGLSETPTAFVRTADRAEASRAGIRAAQLSMLLLLATAFIQLVAVVISDSVALLSDTIHNFADASSGLPVWLALALGRRRPSRRFSYGLHRVEDLAGLTVVILILFSAGAAAYEAIRRLGESGGGVSNFPVAIGGGLVGLVGNHVAAAYRLRVGRRIGSAALVADGYHARADALTSLAAVIGVALAWAGIRQGDPAAALLVVILIAVSLVREVLPHVGSRLLEGVEPELLDRAEMAARSVAGVLDVPAVRARWVGRGVRVELVVSVRGDRTVAEGHGIAVEIEHRLLHEVPEVSTATVHVDPDHPEAHHALADHQA